MTRRSPFFPLVLAGTLVACGPGDNDPGPGGVTVSEARELDEAARELEARRMTEGALDDAGHQRSANGNSPEPGAPTSN